MPIMKAEKVIVREELVMKVKNIFPSMIDDNFLIKNNFIQSKNAVNRSTYTIANWGSHIELKDSNDTSIDIGVNIIKIQSKDHHQIDSFYNMVSNQFDNITEVLYNLVLHYDAENIFNSVMNLMLCNTEMEVDSLRLKKDDYLFDIYECASNRLHLTLQSKMTFNKNFNFSEFITNSTSFFEKFLTNDLKLEN